jgi:hypothetical protein
MSGFAWPLLELTSRLLDRDEREVVLGDLLETNENFCRGLLDVFGLILRRQAAHWRRPGPWLAGLAVTIPSSYLLMTVSLSVSCTYQRLVNHKMYAGPTGHEGFPLLLCHIFVLLAWSWSGGYIVGSVSPRTVWVNAVCYARLFVSLYAGLHVVRIPLSSAGDLRRPPRVTQRSNLASLSVLSGVHRDRIDDLRMEQQGFVDF